MAACSGAAMGGWLDVLFPRELAIKLLMARTIRIQSGPLEFLGVAGAVSFLVSRGGPAEALALASEITRQIQPGLPTGGVVIWLTPSLLYAARGMSEGLCESVRKSVRPDRFGQLSVRNCRGSDRGL